MGIIRREECSHDPVPCPSAPAGPDRPCPGPGGPKAIPVIVAETRLEAFADPVEALGTLKARESVALTANVTETVSAIHFEDGQRVDAGQVLVEMTSAEEHALWRRARSGWRRPPANTTGSSPW